MNASPGLTLPDAFWRYFVEQALPAAQQLTGVADVAECSLQIRIEDPGLSHISGLLGDVDRWFRWAQMLNEQYRTNGTGRPSAHEFPVSSKELTLELVDVTHSWLKFDIKVDVKVNVAALVMVVALLSSATGSGWGRSEQSHDDPQQTTQGQPGGAHPQKIQVPEPSDHVKEQMRGLFGLREGAGHVLWEKASILFTLSDGTRLVCDFPVAQRQVDGDGLFMIGIAAACKQFDELDYTES
ncbi:hypothetical protein [Streptomyces sp. DT203]|uniref:hypothetical protein n=1 Tax=Streptomyces sp. DT203 TaxID=3393424 RepID=UPI003CEA5F0D